MSLQKIVKRLLQKVKSKPGVETFDAHGHVEIAHHIKEQQRQQEVNRLLDKISRHGMSRLSKKEKDFLQQQKQ
jgi:hypothetical protein